MLLKIAATLGLIAVTATPVLAQYTGPSARKAPVTVAEVLKSGTDDQDVRLQGRIVRQVGNDKYIFADGTGEIRVEIDDELFLAALDDKKTVVIAGEVEKDFMESPEIDVETLRLP